MKNSEIINSILEEAERHHVNLWHDVDKHKVYDYVSNIKDIEDLCEEEVDFHMLKIFSMFGDAHTSYYVQHKNLDRRIAFVDGKLYLKCNQQFYEIIEVGHMSAKEFVDKVGELQNYETEEWKKHRTGCAVKNGYYYQMLKVNNGDNIAIKIKQGDMVLTRSIKIISDEEAKLIYQGKDLPIYCYDVVDDCLYVRYRRCDQMKYYPFVQFVKDIESKIEDLKIKKYILDLRNNSGGNSEILNPFQELVKRRGLTGVLIINNGVFSSGRIAVARFKKEFNTPLIGEATGGAAKSYGFNKNLEVAGKSFSVSTKLWDFSNIFGYDGAIQPDVYVPIHLEEIQEQNDVQLDVAKKVLDNQIENNLTTLNR